MSLTAVQGELSANALGGRVASADWPATGAELDRRGYALLPALLEPAECAALIDAYADPDRFRGLVVMARHGFGRGEYQYFAYPLPAIIDRLRTDLYSELHRIANRWHRRLGIGVRYPASHQRFLQRCHRAGQTRPTPLLLKYGPGDYNCLHQDLYGALAFPLQVAILLSRPGGDFAGGEFVLTEQRPRRQSRAQVVDLHQGDAVVFAVNERPVQGARGHYRVKLRHGVSELRSGQRYAAGIIFHDAE